MALNETEQIIKTIENSTHVLIVFKKEFSIDAVASSLALALILKKKNKLVDIACENFALPKHLAFLPQGKIIKDKISNLQKFVIKLNTSNDKIEEFSYDTTNGELNIFITPKVGHFTDEHVTTESSDYKYDLIISLDTRDFESLGELYRNFTDFFYNTTILNIDHKTENEHYGQINLVNPNAVSTTEILFRLINTIDKNLFDQDIATCLLTGLISSTRSFKTSNVTPQTLEIAGRLMQLGADREKIIRSLYRSHTVATMNLWGRVLARLKSEDGNKLVWSVLTYNDFVESGADQNSLPDVIDELISFVPGVEIVVLIFQLEGKNNVLINTLKNHNALFLTNTYSPLGTKTLARFAVSGKSLMETEKEVIANIKQKLGQKQ